MRQLFITVLCLTACGVGDPNPGDDSTSNEAPVITGDVQQACASFTDQRTCLANSADHCSWVAYGRPCQVGQTCAAGVCFSNTGGGGSSDAGVGSGGGTACACANGQVCYEQLGGPAQQANASPTIMCKLPPASCRASDVCQCFTRANGGTDFSCHASTSVSGLCDCDNGIR